MDRTMTVFHANRNTLDDKDAQIVQRRSDTLIAQSEPDVGDFVIFADGVERRISHVWNWEDDHDIQTSDGGSWYLGEGYCSFSGGLFTSVKASTLVNTGTTRPGSVWIFHHDFATAHNGIDTQIEFKVWKCGEVAPR
jgi:hypothetical protein